MASDDITYSRPVHESGVVLALQVLLLQLAVGAAALVINLGLVNAIDIYQQSTFLLLALGTETIVLQTIDAVLLILLVMRWANTTYIITRDSVVIQSGILHVRTATYKANDINSVEVEQSFLGKLFNYGTLVMRSPSLADIVVRLSNVPNPHRYSQMITEGSQSQGQGQGQGQGQN